MFSRASWASRVLLFQIGRALTGFVSLKSLEGPIIAIALHNQLMQEWT
uniref:Glycosyl hydrolase family 3 protein n=1 Tax=Arundo donax TaxID=35708 RepID=A0A0A9CWE3_ARUDO